MNTSPRHVAPEEVMAFLDGELSTSEAQAVSAHVEECADCSAIAAQFRSTSQSLSHWSVQAIPKKLEDSVTEQTAKVCAGNKIAKPGLFIRASLWTRKQWLVGLGSAVTLVLVLIGLSSGNYQRSSKEARRAVANVRLVQESPGGSSAARGLDSLTVDPLPTPMIARIFSLSIVVKDFATSRSSLDSILAKHHAYSAQMGVRTPESAPRSLQASLRIPVPELSSAIAELKALGHVENESQSGEEVSQQHTDLVARLKNSRETEQRFREILQQRTGNVAEVLQVEEGIARVRGEIECMEAEQKTLEHRVEFATVEVQLTEEYKAQLSGPAPSVSLRFHNAFVAGYRDASETIIGFLLFFAEYGPTLLIWMLILLLPAILIWRRYRRALATI